MIVGEEFKELHKAEDLRLYEASDKVLREIGNVALDAIVGPYGSGKDTIIDWLAVHFPHLFASVIGDTSRPKRKGEINGKQHHFRKESAMIRDMRRGSFVQVALGSGGTFYATRPEQYPKDKIAIKAIYAREVPKFRRLGFKKVEWLQIVPYGFEAWLSWRQDNSMDAADQIERDKEAIESISSALTNPDTHFILNDKISEAAMRIVRFTEGRRIPDEVKARQIAARNLETQKRWLKQKA